MSENLPERQTAVVGSDPFPAISQRRRRGVQVTSAAAIALGLILSGGAVAGATTPTPTSTGSPSSAAKSGQLPFGGARPTAVGTVKTVGDGTFTITAPDGSTVTVEVDSSTTYFDPGLRSPSSVSVTVGEHVAVFGSETSDSVTATRVAVGLPPAGGRGGPGDGVGPGRSTGSGPGGNPERGPGRNPANAVWPSG